MDSIEEWPEVADYEYSGVHGHYALTIWLTKGIKVSQAEGNVPTYRISDVWTLVTEEFGMSDRVQTMLFPKAADAIEEGDVSHSLIEEPSDNIQYQRANAMVRLVYQTVEVGDAEIR